MSGQLSGAMRKRGIVWILLFFALLIPVFLHNHAWFLLLNGMHGKFGDAIFGVITGLGDGLVVALLCSCIMMWRFRAGVAGMSAFIVSGLLDQLLKRLFDMPRPAAVFEYVHVLGDRLYAHSFPSGHATSDGVMIALSLLLWGGRAWRAWLGVVLFALAAYGRIYVGAHFPLDVWVGLGLGTGTMWLCWRWLEGVPEQSWERSMWVPRIAGLILLIEAGVLGLGYGIQPSTASILCLVLPTGALVWLMYRWRGIGNQGLL